MVIPEADLETVAKDAHAVIDEAKAAGVYVFTGGLNEEVPTLLVSASGSVSEPPPSAVRQLDGGFTVLELTSHEDAVEWAARIARACRCDQELRVFQIDPDV